MNCIQSGPLSIASVLADVRQIEIIIVDDCSRDGTRELLKTEIAPLVEKIVYHEKNQGKALLSGRVSPMLPAISS